MSNSGGSLDISQETVTAQLQDNAGTAITLGQKVAASSVPVVLASDQGNSTAANQTTEITSLQILDDVPTAQNGAFSKGNPIMGQLDDASTTAATEDNCAVGRITAQRAHHVNLRNNAGIEIGTSGNPIRQDPTGTTAQPVYLTTAPIATYSASAQDIVAAALATDVFTITGSNTKTIRIIRIEVSGTETTGAVRDVSLIKRSSANSGGISTTSTAVPHDSADAAATATVRAYTANPTLGTAVGLVRSVSYAIPATNLSTSSALLIWDWSNRASKAPVLRGTGEVLAVNFDAATLSGSNLEFSVEFTEE